MATKTIASNTARGFGEIAGWYGACAIVLAYFLVSFKVIRPDGLVYQLLNLTGAIGIIVISAIKGVRQSVVLNAFWAVIALIALLRFTIWH
jgi:hypothetical protein